MQGPRTARNPQETEEETGEKVSPEGGGGGISAGLSSRRGEYEGPGRSGDMR